MASRRQIEYRKTAVGQTDTGCIVAPHSEIVGPPMDQSRSHIRRNGRQAVARRARADDKLSRYTAHDFIIKVEKAPAIG